MSTSTPNANKSNTNRDEKRFVSLTDPAPMTPEKLERCEEPRFDLDAVDGTPVYAVAHQHGIVQDPANDREYEALCVLYLTADGEQAVEMWTPAACDEFERVQRATFARDGKLSEGGEYAAKVAPVVNEHPEV